MDWSRLAADAMNSHFLPNVLVGLKLGLAKPCFGSTIALRRDTWLKSADFSVCRPACGRLRDRGGVRRLGLRVAIPPMLVSHICYDQTFADLVRHELRAARTIRSIDPLGYVGLLATNPTPFALAAVALGDNLASLSLLLLALASRMAVSIQAGRLAVGRGAFWLGPFRDLLSFAIFLASFLPGSLVWRGRRFELRSDGTLRPS
jgi:ceramide glucosyltransferase